MAHHKGKKVVFDLCLIGQGRQRSFFCFPVSTLDKQVRDREVFKTDGREISARDTGDHIFRVCERKPCFIAGHVEKMVAMRDAEMMPEQVAPIRAIEILFENTNDFSAVADTGMNCMLSIS